MLRKSPCWLISACALLSVLGPTERVALAQLRIVTYNTANGTFPPDNDPVPRTGMDNVLQAIADEVTNGIAKPIDVLIFQEHDHPTTTTQDFVDLLNVIYGAGTYARSTVVTQPTFPDDNIRQTMVYNTNTLSLIGEIAFGLTGSTGNRAARQTSRYQLRPVGYDASADFYVYNDHYKAGTGSTNEARRNFEANTIRTNSDNVLGQGAHVIYAGDYNIQSSTEAMYQTLLAEGNGQAFDPINTPGNWNFNSGFAAVHTQSPHDGSVTNPDLTTGGMNDRFDFQLVTGEFLDDEGLSYISGSYRAFGNNGTTYNQAVNAGSNTYPLSQSILDDLAHVSDHLPVVADYQLPAKMEVTLGAFPTTVNLGDLVNVDVFVENIAPVLFANGADELDYDITLVDDLLGGSLNQVALPLAGANSYQISFDTSTTGMKSGTLTVASDSQSVMDGKFSMLFQYEVIDPGGGFLEADFNEDTLVDTADLAQWEGDFGLNGNSDADDDGDSDGADFLVWQQQNGQSSLVAASQAVPEPSSAVILLTLTAMLLPRLRSARKTRSLP